MAKNEVVQIIEGQWVNWHNKETWECCDCALVHRVEMRKVKGQLQVRMYRDNRRTGQRRRRAKLKRKDLVKVTR
jgi:Zn-finger protein